MKDILSRKIEIGGERVEIDLNNPLARYTRNPVVHGGMVNKVWEAPHLQVKTVHNAGIAAFNDDVVMLFRSHLRNGISVLGIARSKDGLTDWRVDSGPATLRRRQPKSSYCLVSHEMPS